MESQDERQSAVHNALTMLSDTALITVMSQCMLLLKQPQISNRQKQLLKRELSDELVSIFYVTKAQFCLIGLQQN